MSDSRSSRGNTCRIGNSFLISLWDGHQARGGCGSHGQEAKHHLGVMQHIGKTNVVQFCFALHWLTQQKKKGATLGLKRQWLEREKLDFCSYKVIPWNLTTHRNPSAHTGLTMERLVMRQKPKNVTTWCEKSSICDGLSVKSAGAASCLLYTSRVLCLTFYAGWMPCYLQTQLRLVWTGRARGAYLKSVLRKRCRPTGSGIFYLLQRLCGLVCCCFARSGIWVWKDETAGINRLANAFFYIFFIGGWKGPLASKWPSTIWSSQSASL